MVEEKREKTKQQQKQTLSEKKEEAGNVSVQRDRGWIRVICVHDTTHLAVTTTLWGSRHPRNKRASKEKKQSMARTGH